MSTQYRLVLIVDGVAMQGDLQDTNPILACDLDPATGQIVKLEIDSNVEIKYMNLNKLSMVGVQTFEKKRATR